MVARVAPGAKESIYTAGSGVKLTAGTQIVLQMHYNLRAGQGVDNSAVKLRLSDQTEGIESVHTMLLRAGRTPPAPGESRAALQPRGRS